MACFKCNGLGKLGGTTKDQGQMCKDCNGVGLKASSGTQGDAGGLDGEGVGGKGEGSRNKLEETDVVIAGCGIAGPALQIALTQRGISSVIVDRDAGPCSRPQGYGLTLQQGMRALRGLGFDLDKLGAEGVEGPASEFLYTDRHVVMDKDGDMKGEWGMRKWTGTSGGKKKKHNMVVSRLNLRNMLLEECNDVRWGTELKTWDKIGKDSSGRNLRVTFADGSKDILCDLLVGADGIRSTVR